MKFLGPSLVLTNSMFPEDRLSEVMVLQQHCGGSTLCVFRELLPPNSKLYIILGILHHFFPSSKIIIRGLESQLAKAALSSVVLSKYTSALLPKFSIVTCKLKHHIIQMDTLCQQVFVIILVLHPGMFILSRPHVPHWCDEDECMIFILYLQSF